MRVSALLGEWYAGSGTSSNDIVMMTLGTGIGGVAMIDGRLLVGKHFQAGCLGGHVAARFDGSPCNCGGIGCAESEASGWALPRICANWPGFESSSLAGVELNFQNLFHAADEGDSVALAVREHLHPGVGSYGCVLDSRLRSGAATDRRRSHATRRLDRPVHSALRERTHMDALGNSPGTSRHVGR